MLLIGAVLATPYVLDYDLVLLAPTIAFLAVHGASRGFGPYEKTLLAALWLLLLAARSVAQATHIPPVAPLMQLVLIAMLRRAMAETGGHAAPHPVAAE